jgi:sporulation protein YlmC with PRC-barrel domain
MKATMQMAVWGIVMVAILSLAMCSAAAGNTNTNSGSVKSRRQAPPKVEKASGVIGREIRSDSNQPIAKISELMVELQCGRVLYGIVSLSSTNGTPDRLVAVAPEAFLADGNKLRVIGGDQKLLGAPQYFKGDARQVEMESPAFVMSVYKWFGQDTWWEPGTETPDFMSIFKVSELTGMKVRGIADQKIGIVDNVMVDLSNGRVSYVILSPDPSLHLAGNNLYAVPPNSLTSANDGGSLNTSIDRDKLAAAPRFDKNHWPDMSNPAWASQVYQAYGKQAFFEDGTLLPTSRRTNSSQRIYHEPEKTKP